MNPQIDQSAAATSQPTPVQPVPVPPVLPASKSKLPLILGGIILLIIVGAGGIFLGKSLNNSLKSAQPTVSPLPTQIPTIAVDETTNWKIYKNDKYGFQVKYSPDLAPREAPEGKTQKLSVSFGTLKDDHSFDVEIFEKDNIGYYRYRIEGQITEEIDADVNGLKGTKFTYSQALSTDYVIFSKIIIPNGSLDYIITAKTSDFDQILSTFKFLDQGETLLPTPDPKLAPYFDKLAVTLTDKTSFTNYYTSYWFWCAFSYDKRILPSSYEPFLQSLGILSSGETAYILSNIAPYPGNTGENQHFIPSPKNGSDQYMTQAQWKEFLLNQPPDYPVIITKDSSGKLLMYIRQDYLFLPGC